MQQSSSSPLSRFLLLTAAFVIVVAGIKAAESLLVPFLLSLFIAIISSPLLSFMKRFGLPNSLAIMAIIVLIVIFGTAIVAIVGSSIDNFRADLPEYQQKLLSLTDNLQRKLASIGIQINPAQWREIVNPSSAFSFLGNTLAQFGNVMTSTFLILLTVTFILAEEVRFIDKLQNAAGSSQKTLDAIRRFTSSVNKYMAIKTLVSMVTGLTAIISLMIIGVDYPVLWGLLAFLLNFVPTLGSLLAAVPPVLLALIQLGIGEAAVTALVYVAINVFIGNVVEPRWMGKGLNLSTLVVFLSLVFWGWVLGPVGMLLSVPLTMTVKIALENFSDTHWLGVMLGSGIDKVERHD